LDFLVTLWNAKKVYQQKAVYCAGKLEIVSRCFKVAVEARSGYENRLPWLDALPVYTVVWIDARPEAYDEATILKNATLKNGNVLNIKFFNDDRETLGSSNAWETAQDYVIDAISTKRENIVAIIINCTPEHKQMVNNIVAHCGERGEPAPFCASCSRRDYAEFAGSAVTFVHTSRKAVQTAVVEEFQTRAAGGHTFEEGQEVVVWGPHGGWVKGDVHRIEGAGSSQIVVVGVEEHETEIQADRVGFYLRAPPSDSVFWKIVTPSYPPGEKAMLLTDDDEWVECTIVASDMNGDVHVNVSSDAVACVVPQQMVISHLQPLDFSTLRPRAKSDILEVKFTPQDNDALSNDLGFEYNCYTGKVEDVADGGLPWGLGIRSGWYVKQVGSEYYHKKLNIHETMKGGMADHVITFSQAPHNLLCPGGHVIEERKEGLRWHEGRGFLGRHAFSCSICSTDLDRKDARWHCTEQCCAYAVCDSCFAKRWDA